MGAETPAAGRTSWWKAAFRDPRRRWALLALAVVLVAWALHSALERAAASALRAAAHRRGYQVGWNRLELGWDASIRARGLRVTTRVGDDTVLAARSLEAWPDLMAVLGGRVGVRSVRLEEARFVRPAEAAVDSLAGLETTPADEEPERGLPPLAAPLRSALRQLTRDFARLPRVQLSSAVFVVGGVLDSLVVDTLDFDPRARVPLVVSARYFAPVEVAFRARAEVPRRGGGLELTATGSSAARGDRLPMTCEQVRVRLVPSGLRGRYRLEAEARDVVLRGPSLSRRPMAGMQLRASGDLEIRRNPARLALSDTTLLEVGAIPVRLGFELDEGGPTAGFNLRADGLTAARLRSELPEAVLGPLEGVGLRGSFDYRLRIQVNLSEPEEAVLQGDVVPRGLRLEEAGAGLALGALNEPFLARVHLPAGRFEARWVGPENPFFVPLPELPPELVYAVLANEDGGFFEHRGLSVEAMRAALAENLRRGRFVRGAGTISMQLVRNLWLGHERSLARKAQEIALTWLLENLARVPKERLLETYLNVIEWAPGVHGAGEASRFYFDKDARGLTLDEALFLTVVVPSPRLWRYRFDRGTGELRRGTRQQMHYIARAMVRKGWLDPGRLPASAEDMRVELRGEARSQLIPPDDPAKGSR
jgi:hypothetical protein